MTTPPSTRPPEVLVLVGPTASGKTRLAVELAREWNAEIVSADSRQVYRFMDIGTAKPSLGERGGIPHHGFDVADPDEFYSAGRFAREAREWIAEILGRGKRVVVAGGSGLYLRALVDGFFGEDVRNPEIRQWLNGRVESEGLEALHNELTCLDPEYAAKTTPGDRQRILRALEVVHTTGVPFSSLHEQGHDPAPFGTAWFGIERPREELYNRINRRVDEMFDRGLLAEVQDLLDRGYRGCNALKSVGYEELIAFLDGRLPDLDTARALIKRNTRRYAKRQLTWFRKDPRIRWLEGSMKFKSGIIMNE